MSNNEFPGFDACIDLIRSKDPMIFEDGYHLLLPRVKDFGDRIVKLIQSESDPKIKPRFVELLGECEDKQYLPIFEKLLESEIHDVVAWSLTSLERINSGLSIAEKFRKNNPKWSE